MALIEIDNFLSEGECDVLIDIIESVGLQRSYVASDDPKDYSKISESRTSSTCMLHKDDPFVLDIHEKISDYVSIPLNHGEFLQGQRYKAGQFFKPHRDYFENKTAEKHCLSGGNRIKTFMVYLNDDIEGGETDFPEMGRKIKPKKGKAIVWDNIIDGVLQSDTLHEGCPIIKGTKYIITSWWRENPIDEEKDKQLLKELKNKNNETSPVLKNDITSTGNFPKCDPIGFKVIKCPREVWGLVKYGYELGKKKKTEEIFNGKEDIIKGNGVSSEMLPIFEIPEFTSTVHSWLQSIHEDFAGGRKLIPTFIYGIRSYLKDSSLVMHIDRQETHHISSILIVDKDLDGESDWPLEIVDHSGKTHLVYADVGDLILYESAVCSHGRPSTFRGNFFRNMFIHYKFA
jgi:prolyl 4-hydroxylase